MPKGKKNVQAKKSKKTTTVTTVRTSGRTSKPKQHAASRVSLERVARAAVITADQEEQWKYGMFDPEHAARGPGTSQLPTVVLTYRSVTDITTTAYAVGSTSNFQVDSTGGALLIVTPITMNAVTVANAANPYSGVWCSTNDNLLSLNTGSLGGTSLLMAAAAGSHAAWLDPINSQSYVPVKPTFFQQFQGSFPVAFEADTVETQIYQPWRVAGLRATLTQTTSVLNAQGSIAAGDFGDFFYTGKPGIEADPLGAVANDVVVQTLDITSPEWAINQGNNLSRFRQVGSLAEPGSVFEAIALPVNELFWQYHNSAGEISAAALWGNDGFQTMYSSLQFLPAVGFLLRGIAPGNTFRLNVTLSIETQVDLSTPLAFLYNACRFTDGYFPNLRDLRMSPTGGHLGELLALRANGCEGCAILLQQRVTGGAGIARGRSGNTYIVGSSGSAPATPMVGAISPTAPAAQQASQGGGVFSSIMQDVGKAIAWTGENAPAIYRAGQLVGKIGSNIWGAIRGVAGPMIEAGEAIAPEVAMIAMRKGRRGRTASYGNSVSYVPGHEEISYNMHGGRRNARSTWVPGQSVSHTPDAYGRLY